MSILSKYETYETANDEIDRAIATLKGLEEEFSPIKKPLDSLTISTFFPLNLPIYSLVIFGIAPSAFAKNVFIRPPEVMHEVLTELYSYLKINDLFPNISLHAVQRYIFMDLYAYESDVIIFTGKYENALDIHKKCPQALLVYNGSGINPFVVLENADIDLAVQKAVEMRCFNSGQDCAGPDAFFVPHTLSDLFVGKLQQELENIKVGSSADPKVRVSKTIKNTYIEKLKEFLTKERENLAFGGEIDYDKHLVYPSIVRKTLQEHGTESFHEFFAPVFYILEYNNTSELERTLLSQDFKDHTMYICLFGSDENLKKKLGFATVVENQIVNDVEFGNGQYGGYGSKSNFLLYGDIKIDRPMLISRDIHEILADRV
ncbi:MAG: ALDH-like protein [Candidatus Saccharibacteria bacterium]|nr:ALDH-like protein [Candidatus Saccharibacteria bacterium]